MLNLKPSHIKIIKLVSLGIISGILVTVPICYLAFHDSNPTSPATPTGEAAKPERVSPSQPTENKKKGFWFTEEEIDGLDETMKTQVRAFMVLVNGCQALGIQFVTAIQMICKILGIPFTGPDPTASGNNTGGVPPNPPQS